MPKKKTAIEASGGEVHVKLLRIPSQLHEDLKQVVETRFRGMSMSSVILLQLNELVRANRTGA
jgi:hypothetical protein